MSFAPDIAVATYMLDYDINVLGIPERHGRWTAVPANPKTDATGLPNSANALTQRFG
jgi:hypothetical protein